MTCDEVKRRYFGIAQALRRYLLPLTHCHLHLVEKREDAFVRTTIELHDPLFHEAKATAVQLAPGPNFWVPSFWG